MYPSNIMERVNTANGFRIRRGGDVSIQFLAVPVYARVPKLVRGLDGSEAYTGTILTIAPMRPDGLRVAPDAFPPVPDSSAYGERRRRALELMQNG